MLLCGLTLPHVRAQATTDPLPTPTVGSTAPDFSLSVAAPPALLKRGDKLTLTAIVGGLGGFANPVTLSVVGTLPAGIGVSFAPSTVTPIAPKPTWPATIESDMVIDTGLPSTTTTARLEKTRPGLGAAWAAMPFLFSLGMMGWRRRGTRPLVAGVLLTLLPFAGGCGSGIHSAVGSSGGFILTVQATAGTGQQHTVPLLVRVSE